jgi:two-component system, NarL family, sensor histidine kinase DegS
MSFDEARAALEERDPSVRERAAGRRRLFADIATAQEQERRRIAGEIHDGALQTMVVVLLRLGQLMEADGGPHDPVVVVQLEASVRDAISEIRRLIAGLVPHELDSAGLVPAVHRLLAQIATESGIGCRLDNRIKHEPQPDQRTIAFRVTQEALANARKHASPSRIDVLLESRDRGVGARIADDGAGFVVAAALQDLRPGHMGLATMHERVAMAGGWLRIESSERGTVVSFWIPDRVERGQ